MAIAYIGIGSNLGAREENLMASLDFIRQKVGVILSESKVIESEPWGFEAVTKFLNMVVRIRTMLHPHELLNSLLEIESIMGRTRSPGAYQSRIIDLDILFYDDLILDSDDLVIPHPLIQHRLFVLEPLAEIDPDLVHPVLKKTIRELIQLVQEA